MSKVAYIDEIEIKNKKILIRVDYNVSLTKELTINDDSRIKQSLPTINFLLKNNNRLILISHLGRPKNREPEFSLKVVTQRLQSYLPNYKVIFINDFLNDEGQQIINNQKNNEIIILENIRYYSEEKKNNPDFAKKLAQLADIFVNDAFAVCHRNDSSVVGITQFIPSLGGLLLKKEVESINKIIQNPQKPIVAVIGGAKISTKINFIDKLMTISDYVLLGGCLANAFLKAKGYETGISFCEPGQTDTAKNLIIKAEQNKRTIILPVDVVVGNIEDSVSSGKVKKITEVNKDENILDIGPETQKLFAFYINQAKTIVWNGPMGYFENPIYAKGTDNIYNSIANKKQVVSIVGGGDTLTAISKKTDLNKITHISTGGGAMLELIEKSTLPGIEALKK